MKKHFLTIMVVAMVTTCFMSCERTTIDSDTHTQKFTIGSDTYDIKNAFTIESIKDSGMIYNVIVLSQSEEVGSTGSRTKGVFIVFRGDITPGSYNLFYDPQEPSAHYPMYLVTELNMDNIINFSLENLLNQSDVYVADNGSFTLGINQDKFTVTTTNIEVKNVNDQTQVKTSSTDYEGSMLRYVLSTVEEGDFNGTEIVTAGTTKLNILNSTCNVVAFITANGDLIGIISSTSFDSGIPEGTYSYNDNSIIYMPGMSLQSLKFASSGEATVARNGDTYTVNMTGLTFNGISGSPTLHYVGIMPKFDFPFPQE